MRPVRSVWRPTETWCETLDALRRSGDLNGLQRTIGRQAVGTMPERDGSPRDSRRDGVTQLGPFSGHGFPQSPWGRVGKRALCTRCMV